MKKFITLSLVSVFMLSSCATIFKGNHRKVSFDKPSDADIYIDGELVGKTPYKAKLANDKSYTVYFVSEGKKSKIYNLRRTVSAGYVVLDVLFTGLIGVVVDIATGSWYYLDSEQIEMDYK